MSDYAIAIAILLAALIMRAPELISLFQQGKLSMSALDDKIQALKDAVAADTTVHGSVKTLIAGFAQRMADAVAAATAAGATDAQLQSIQDVIDSVKAGSDDLAKAVTDGTPAAPTTDTPANP